MGTMLSKPFSTPAPPSSSSTPDPPSSSSTPAPPSSSSTPAPPRRWTYDVFLSFRGEDTRLNFVDHLYAALNQRGIHTFRDDRSLERGTVISSELLKAIEESRFAIVILSPNYASSSWCLDELLKIIQCRREKGQVVMPVFYHVDPSHVRKNKEYLLQVHTEHEVVHWEDRDKVRKWRDALTEVANLSGWDLRTVPEAEAINRIVKEILDKSQYRSTSINKDTVGMDSRVDDLLTNHIRPRFDDVRMIGIHGMQGIGKTAVARALYDQLCPDFDSSYEPSNVGERFRKGGKNSSQYQIGEGFERCCFLSNVREKSLVSLQETLLSKILMVQISNIENEYTGAYMIQNRLGQMRVLVVIDDVDQGEQLEYLAGNRDWFGPGSRIIITSFNAHLLNDVDSTYRAALLTHDEALQLLSLKAFNESQPHERFLELSRDILGYAQGLPLAIVVIGSFLRDKSIEEWADAIDRIRRRPRSEIIDVLQICFDGLEPDDKEIFLHIACFYKGKDRDRVVEILDYFKLNPVIGLRDLVDRCLITVSDNEVSMHSLLQEMGREIVCRESPNNPGKRSRLWSPEDIHKTLRRNKGTEAVRGMVLDLPKLEKAHWKPEAFSNMSELNLLQIRNVDLPNGLNCLSDSLKLLEWSGYPLRFLPQNFEPDELIEFSLCHSKIEQLWQGIKNFDELKFIKLCHSHNIIETPDLTGAHSLEKLDLEGCRNLVRVHQSLGTLKKLIVLNLKGCVSLESMPDINEMESLETLILSGCSKIKKIPEFSGNMKCLSDLYLDRTAIEDLPRSIEHLSGLSSLDLSNRKSLDRPSMPRQEPRGFQLRLCGLGNLTDLNISKCNLDDRVLRDFSWPPSLVALNLSGNDIRGLPPDIRSLRKLENINLEKCKKLEKLDNLPSSCKLDVRADGCDSLRSLFGAVRDLARMETYFSFLNCFGLREEESIEFFHRTLKHQATNKMETFQMVYPAFTIRRWFTRGSYVFPDNMVRRRYSSRPVFTYEMGPLRYSSRLVGFALCAEYIIQSRHAAVDDELHTQYWKTLKATHHLVCYLKVNGVDLEARGRQPAYRFRHASGRVLLPHHWVFYVASDKYFGIQEHDSCSEIEVMFETSGPGGPGLQVNECGLRLIFENDVHEWNNCAGCTGESNNQRCGTHPLY